MTRRELFVRLAAAPVAAVAAVRGLPAVDLWAKEALAWHPDAFSMVMVTWGRRGGKTTMLHEAAYDWSQRTGDVIKVRLPQRYRR